MTKKFDRTQYKQTYVFVVSFSYDDVIQWSLFKNLIIIYIRIKMYYIPSTLSKHVKAKFIKSGIHHYNIDMINKYQLIQRYLCLTEAGVLIFWKEWTEVLNDRLKNEDNAFIIILSSK